MGTIVSHMVERRPSHDRGTVQRPRPTGDRLQTQVATVEEIKIRVEGAAAVEAAVVDVVAVTAGAEVTETGATRAPRETTRVK